MYTIPGKKKNAEEKFCFAERQLRKIAILSVVPVVYVTLS